ncbi:MAG TPA: RyR domain-containing protein, partial [Acidimicrobiia bacterium]|nr:RyR domain-containing protein [Acidimicrobiia bacterium]
PGSEAAAAARGRGAVVLVGDASDGHVLRRAGLRRARFLVSVCGEDATNAGVVVAARGLVVGRKGTLRAFVHVVDADLCGLLRAREIAGHQEGGLRVEFFNVYDRGAGILLQRFPPFPVSDGVGHRSPHLVVVGLGRLGSSLVVQAARMWRDLPDRAGRLRISVVDRDAGPRLEALAVGYPQLGQLCELRPLAIETKSAAFGRADFLLDSEGRRDAGTVFICLDDPAQGLNAGLALLPRIGGGGVPVVVRVVQSAGLAGLIQEDAPRPAYRDLHAFPLLDETCTPDLLLGGTYETLGRAIHEDYVAHQRSQGQTTDTNPTMVAWEQLPEHVKESNRDQAADMGAKLAAVGCGLTPLTDWEAPLLVFTPEEVERLARMEHERWVAHLLSSGWSLAPGPKDPERRTHPDLIPYDQLGEEKRELDRNAARGIPAFLARAGFHAYRLD